MQVPLFRLECGELDAARLLPHRLISSQDATATNGVGMNKRSFPYTSNALQARSGKIQQPHVSPQQPTSPSNKTSHTLKYCRPKHFRPTVTNETYSYGWAHTLRIPRKTLQPHDPSSTLSKRTKCSSRHRLRRDLNNGYPSSSKSSPSTRHYRSKHIQTRS